MKNDPNMKHHIEALTFLFQICFFNIGIVFIFSNCYNKFILYL